MISTRNILLVEDNSKDVELTLEAMAENNLDKRVVVVRDGVQAMDYLLRAGQFSNRKPGNPAVILLDIKMPRMDGIQVLRNIRGTAELKRIPVVMLTTSREEPDLTSIYDLGVNAYVVKPLDFQQFIEAVRQIGNFWAILNELPPEGGER
jgi:CheY-like chemotaxis protein